MINLPLRIPSPAKINLFLRILKQREDGYHNLQTIFQFIDLCDWLTFEANQQDQIICSYHNQDITLENDLILKAARLIQMQSSDFFGINIHLEKNIPIGGGLGGGSSNAASTLLILNHVWKANLTQAQLLQLAQQLGADVPIFIRGISSWAEGIGNIFTDYYPGEGVLGLIYPNISINTAKIFNSEFLIKDNPILIPDSIQAQQYLGINDCSSAIFQHYPIIKTYIDLLAELNITAYITGTGACLFFKYDIEKTQLITELCQKFNWQFWAINSQNTSTLKLYSPDLFKY